MINSLEGAKEWQKLIKNMRDEETGVKIERKEPIKVLGIYHSILEGTIQKVAESEESGIITNLDRSKAEKKYNPSVFITAMFLAKAIKNK